MSQEPVPFPRRPSKGGRKKKVRPRGQAPLAVRLVERPGGADLRWRDAVALLLEIGRETKKEDQR